MSPRVTGDIWCNFFADNRCTLKFGGVSRLARCDASECVLQKIVRAPDRGQAGKTGRPSPERNFKIFDVKGDMVDSRFHLKGKVKYTGTKVLGKTSVVARFYNKDGISLGNAVENIENLGPGMVWDLNMICNEDGKPWRYEIRIMPQGKGP